LKSSLAGVLCALGSFAIFSLHDVVVKLLAAHYSAVQIAFFTSLFTFPLLTIFLLGDNTDRRLRPRHPYWVLLRSLCATGNVLFSFYAFSVLPMAQTYAFFFATPLVVTILAVPLLGERVGWHRGLAVAAGMVGILIVLRPGAAELQLGHIAALSGACCSATSAVIIRKIGRDERPVVMLISPMLSNVLLMGCALPLAYRPMPMSHLAMAMAIAGLATIAGLLMISAYRRAEAALVAPMQYSQMLWGTIFGYLIFGHGIDRYTFFGSGVIILSGIYIILRESRRSRRHGAGGDPLSGRKGAANLGRLVAPEMTPPAISTIPARNG
jgi:S-adenosylmethionine uptake transporter